MATWNLNLLVLDDDPEMTALLADVLGSRFTVRTANSEVEAMAAMRRQLPDVLLCDYHLGAGTSAGLLKAVARHFPMVRRILMSGAPAHEWHALLRDGVVE